MCVLSFRILVVVVVARRLTVAEGSIVTWLIVSMLYCHYYYCLIHILLSSFFTPTLRRGQTWQTWSFTRLLISHLNCDDDGDDDATKLCCVLPYCTLWLLCFLATTGIMSILFMMYWTDWRTLGLLNNNTREREREIPTVVCHFVITNSTIFPQSLCLGQYSIMMKTIVFVWK